MTPASRIRPNPGSRFGPSNADRGARSCADDLQRVRSSGYVTWTNSKPTACEMGLHSRRLLERACVAESAPSRAIRQSPARRQSSTLSSSGGISNNPLKHVYESRQLFRFPQERSEPLDQTLAILPDELFDSTGLVLPPTALGRLVSNVTDFLIGASRAGRTSVYPSTPRLRYRRRTTRIAGESDSPGATSPARPTPRPLAV